MGHLVQPPCQSRVTCSRLHRTLSRRILNISREGDSTTSLGNLFQCSVTHRVKKFFLMFRWNFLCFILCPLLLVLSLGTTEESGPILLTPTLQIFITSTFSLVFFRLNKPSSLSFSSQDRCYSPLILVALHWTLSSSSSSFLKWVAQNWTQYSRWGLTRAE